MAVVKVPPIPNESELSAVRALCEIPEPYSSYASSESLFMKAMREIVAWHQARSPFYQRLLEQYEIQPSDLKTESDLPRLPMIPANFFKTHEVRSLSSEEILMTLTSSGTTGQKSQMSFDEWSIRAPQRMVEFIFNHYGWVTPHQKTNYLLYTYEVEPDSRLGTAFTDHFLCGFAPVNRAAYALKRNGSGGHEFDVFGTIEMLRDFEREGLPVRIFGFPAFLFFTLKRMKDLGLPQLKLHPESFVFLGGGWKGHADQAIEPAQLYQMAHDYLGIPDAGLRDGFGSVEHCIPYVECVRHHFHVPVWSRVFIRDVKTLEILPSGQPGFLQLVSPYITSAPAQSVLMGDLAEMHGAETCDCGTNTPWFKILGRAGISKNKSCAIAASELLRGVAQGAR